MRSHVEGRPSDRRLRSDPHEGMSWVTRQCKGDATMQLQSPSPAGFVEITTTSATARNNGRSERMVTGSNRLL
jgi:hypothetical protein